MRVQIYVETLNVATHNVKLKVIVLKNNRIKFLEGS